jgi:hypothetical protein
MYTLLFGLFRFTVENDICLLVLETELELNDEVNTINLPEAMAEPTEGIARMTSHLILLTLNNSQYTNVIALH